MHIVLYSLQFNATAKATLAVQSCVLFFSLSFFFALWPHVSGRKREHAVQSQLIFFFFSKSHTIWHHVIACTKTCLSVRDECWLSKRFIVFVWMYIMYLNNRLNKKCLCFSHVFLALAFHLRHMLSVSGCRMRRVAGQSRNDQSQLCWPGSRVNGLKVSYYSDF